MTSIAKSRERGRVREDSYLPPIEPTFLRSKHITLLNPPVVFAKLVVQRCPNGMTALAPGAEASALVETAGEPRNGEIAPYPLPKPENRVLGVLASQQSPFEHLLEPT
jgi:hypothetical protein